MDGWRVGGWKDMRVGGWMKGCWMDGWMDKTMGG